MARRERNLFSCGLRCWDRGLGTLGRIQAPPRKGLCWTQRDTPGAQYGV